MAQQLVDFGASNPEVLFVVEYWNQHIQMSEHALQRRQGRTK